MFINRRFNIKNKFLIIVSIYKQLIRKFLTI